MTSTEYRHRAEEYLRLANETTELFAKMAFLEMAAEFRAKAQQLELRERRRRQRFMVEYRFADGRPEGLPRLARELVNAEVAVIMTVGDEAIVAAKNATRTVPIVMWTLREKR
jgi:putative tryptophan/tyrosine transport system substrate-binding protein